MQNHRPHPKPTETESAVLTRSPSGFHAWGSLRFSFLEGSLLENSVLWMAPERTTQKKVPRCPVYLLRIKQKKRLGRGGGGLASPGDHCGSEC